MQRTSLILSLGLATLAPPTRAALQFANVASPVSSTLMAATCDTNATLVAVGTNSTVLTGTFGTGTDHIQWSSNHAPVSISFLSAAFGNNVFLAGGTGGNVLSSPNGVTWGSPTAPFTNFTAYIMGLAFNPRSPGNPNFAAAPALFEIAYSPASLPLAWHGATMTDYSLAESWRAVTSFGVNAFAACGFEGDIRYSTNGGVNWYLSRVPKSSQPDLLGIVSDGNNRLVAVGVGGTILFSPDGAASWSAKSSPAGSTTLNAVTFDSVDGLFLAVGNSGVVLTSPDGSTWTAQSAGSSQNFHGVTFANSGIFEGVGLLVGEGGKAILVGTPPAQAVTNALSSKTNCSFNLPNPPLTATVVPDTTHPAGTVGVDWYNSSGARVGLNTNMFYPGDTLAPPNAPTNYTYYAVARDLRTGFTNASAVPVVLTLYPRPTASVTGTTTICNGQVTTVGAGLTGVPPWTVVWASNGIPIVTNAGILVPTNTLVVSPSDPYRDAATNVLYTVSSLSDFFSCAAFATDLTGGALITVNPRPTASVTGTNTICNGKSSVVQAALTGLGPTWNVTWSSNGIVVATHNGVATRTDTLTVTPVDPYLNEATNVLYQVSALTDNSTGCTNNQPSDLTGGALITINPRPTASVTGTNTICNGQSNVVQAALTGLGPTWNVTWSSNGIVVAIHNGVATRTDTLTVTPVDPYLNDATNVLYQVSALTDNSTGCTNNQPGDLTGGALVTINPRPTASVTGTNTICNGQSSVVQATLTGLGPTWNVTWSSNGIVVATHNGVASRTDTLTVTPVDPYLNEVTNVLYQVSALTDDSTGCTNNQPGDLKGGALITVNPRPTASVTGTNAICNGQSSVVQATLSGLGPTWDVTWSSNGIVVATHTGVASRTDTLTVTPVDPYLNDATNVLYQVSALTDNSTGCTNNQPGDLKGGALITINPRPTAYVTGTNTICNGQSNVVQAALTGLGPTWNVTWSSNGIVVATHNAVASRTDTLTVAPVDPYLNESTNVLYRVSALTDNSTGCTNNQPGDLSGGALITINPRPPAPISSTSQFGCVGLTNLPLTVSLSTGGDSANWYDAATNLVVSRGPSVYAPTNGAAGTNRFYVFEVNANGCESTNSVGVDLVLQPCTNQLAITLAGTNAIVEWYGNYVLQHATNLIPADWTFTTQGLGGMTNYWTNPVAPPPTNNFFRLYGPTN